MKKIVKKSQSGSSFDKKVISSIKVNPAYVKSDSARAKEMSAYKNLRAMAKRGSTAAKEPAVFDASKAQYDKVRSKQTVSTDKNGGTIKKKKK